MKHRSCLTIKAIATLAVGIAFFLSGCQTRGVIVTPEKEPTQDLFALAEQDFQAGNLEQAIANYDLFLRQNPTGEKPRRALYRMAMIHYDRYRYDKALSLLKRINREYPGHPESPMVSYDIARTYFRLGEYQRSNTTALEWIKRYPDNPMKGEVYFLMGRNFRATGDNPRAFYWWLRASEAPYVSPALRAEITERVSGLLKTSPIEELIAMAEQSTGTEFAPMVYHRMASVYLEENKLNEARDAAMALVRSTPEQSWVSIGREILERVEDALSVKPGVIGCLLPLSGPFAIYGQEVLNGIQLGMGMFSSPEGVQGLSLVIKDTGGEAGHTATGVEELVKTENVMAIIGPLASKPATAAAKKAQELGVPIITLTQKEGITAEGEMVFRHFLTPSKEVGTLLETAVNDMGMGRFAILYPDNPYGRFFMNLFWDKVEELGGLIAAVESYEPDQTDFATEIKKMVGLYFPRPESVAKNLKQPKDLVKHDAGEDEEDSEEKPEPIVDFDAVFIPDNHQQVALIAPQFPFHSVFSVRFLGTSLWQSPELIENAKEYVQGAIFPSGFFAQSESEDIEDFVDLYEENFESEPGILAANGYDTIRILRHVMHQGPIRTRKEFERRLLGFDGFYGVTGRISLNPKQEFEKEPVLLTIAGNSFRVLR